MKTTLSVVKDSLRFFLSGVSMNTDMKNIEDSTEETFQNISGMNRELSTYRVDAD